MDGRLSSGEIAIIQSADHLRTQGRWEMADWGYSYI